jgi:protease III
LAALQKVTKDDLIKIYQSLLLNDQSGKMLLQLRGTNFKDKPFATSK